MIDIHCHLCYPQGYENPEEIVKKAKEKGMKGIIASSARFDESLRVLEFAKKHPDFVFPTIGYHPIEGTELEKTIQLIKNQRKNIVGVGEVGLDYHWEKDLKKREKQKEVFKKFISLAKELGLPLVIHSWDAERDCFEMVKDSGVNCVFHCFSGSLDLAKEIISSGFWISISTQICFSKHHKKLAKLVPLENILLETDSPWLSPNRGEKNYPWNIRCSAEKISKIKGIPAEQILETTWENARRVFGLGNSANLFP